MMSKRKFQLVNNGSYSSGEKGTVEYIITVKEAKDSTSYTLAYSHNNIWDEGSKGKKVLKATDHGNGVKIKRLSEDSYVGKANGFNLEYDDFAYVAILFQFINDYDKQLMLPFKTEEIIKFN